MIFARSDPPVSKFKISLRKECVVADVRNICNNSNAKHELFSCINDKPEQEQKFDKIEQFLRGSIVLEQVSEELSSLVDDVKKLEQNVKRSVDQILETCGDSALNEYKSDS
ncbi:hypothetical protein WA026_001882 [Henosepilachna vigintioctopunctata]|uniref:Uncharacterized protein n=1 Tax=Henosepilachna vigintioctopunctata TaxID=420089 RepID=A0AAW1URK0_9CUCU